jgi:NDP-sugar pyrophosphorylase family protein
MEIQLSPHKNKDPERIIAVILCAGKGTRIKDVFPSTPKSLIKIKVFNNEPILGNLISSLLDLKVNLIDIVIGYLGFQIEDYINFLKETGEKKYANISIIDAEKEYQNGPLYSFLSIRKNFDKYSINDVFFVLPGDTIFSKSLLKDVIWLISNHHSRFQEFPTIFYQNIKIDALIQLNQVSYSILKSLPEKEGFYYIKSIEREKINQTIDYIKKVVPIVCFPYKLIKNFLDKTFKMNFTSIREFINFLIKEKGQKFEFYELSSKYKFFDIDSERDFTDFKKSGQ